MITVRPPADRWARYRAVDRRSWRCRRRIRRYRCRELPASRSVICCGHHDSTVGRPNRVSGSRRYSPRRASRQSATRSGPQDPRQTRAGRRDRRNHAIRDRPSFAPPSCSVLRPRSRRVTVAGRRFALNVTVFVEKLRVEIRGHARHHRVGYCSFRVRVADPQEFVGQQERSWRLYEFLA